MIFETKAVRKFDLKTLYLAFSAIFVSATLSACGQVSSTDPNADYIRQIKISAAEKESELVVYAASHSNCRFDSDCETVEMGLRSCGGPRYHVALSTEADDSHVRLLQDELEKLEHTLLVANNSVSTCEYRMPPQVLCVPQGQFSQDSGNSRCQTQN